VEYGNVWPYTDYPALYKFGAKYPILWDLFYKFGCTSFGLWLNEFLLTTFCFDSFRECLNRPSGSTNKRADMVLSVHPLCQDVPLKALTNLDTSGASRDPNDRTTPFVTVVTDLGGAHPTWFSPKYVIIVAMFRILFELHLCFLILAQQKYSQPKFLP